MRLDAHDMELIRDALLRHFTIQELDAAGLLDASPSKALRKQLGEIDLQFFVQFYLGHHFSSPLSDMHKELAVELVNIVNESGRINEVVAWPRGFGKSTWVTLGLPSWCVCYKKRRHILIVSDSFPQAKGQMSTLKEELDHNGRLTEDFGVLKSGKWQEAEIECAGGIKVEALGSGMKIRGRKYHQWRPDLIILDDPEELEAVGSELQREKTKQWFNRSVMRAGMSDTKVFVIGNFIHFDCLTKWLADNPMFRSKIFKAISGWAENEGLWREWRGIVTNLADPKKEETARAFFKLHEVEMMKGAHSTWEDGYSYYDLMLIKVTEGDSTFLMEMQNEVSDPSTRTFRHWAYYRKVLRVEHGLPVVWLVPNNGRPEVRLQDCAVFGATDPSLGQTGKADPSAILLVAKAPTGQGFILEADKKLRPPDKIMADQIKWAREYAITRWGIEAVQFQAFFASQSGKESMQSGDYLPIIPVMQSHRGGKLIRIQSLQPDLENEYILVCDTGQQVLVTELEQAPNGVEDDALDALEIAWRVAQLWKSLESAELIQSEQHRFAQRQKVLRPGSNTSKDPFAEAEVSARRNEIEQQIATLTEDFLHSDMDESTYDAQVEELYRLLDGAEEEQWQPQMVLR